MEKSNMQLVKALPRYGVRERQLDLPPWMAQLERRRQIGKYNRWVLANQERERRAALMEKVKIAVAGAVFVIVSLATAVVR